MKITTTHLLSTRHDS